MNVSWALNEASPGFGLVIDLGADVLAHYMLIERAHSLVDYFTEHRLRPAYIIDAAMVFVIREVLIGLFKHRIPADVLYALAALLFVPGALRVWAGITFQRGRRLPREARSD